VSFVNFSLDSTFTRFVSFPIDEAATHEASRAVFRATQTGDDVGFGLTAGILWAPRRQFQLGAVFRKGPSFAFEQNLQDLAQGAPTGTPTVQGGTFRVPDTFAVGAVSRPNDETTLTFEYAFVRYQALNDDFVAVQANPSGRGERFSIDSGSEFHAGLEYVFANAPKTPAIRVGYWYDPSHVVNYTPAANPDTLDERFAAYLPGEDALSHVTFGAGLPLSPRVEINGGVDLSKRRNIYSLFAVFRF
jgi:long-subunit fatty acid transport protein